MRGRPSPGSWGGTPATRAACPRSVPASPSHGQPRASAARRAAASQRHPSHAPQDDGDGGNRGALLECLPGGASTPPSPWVTCPCEARRGHHPHQRRRCFSGVRSPDAPTWHHVTSHATHVTRFTAGALRGLRYDVYDQRGAARRRSGSSGAFGGPRRGILNHPSTHPCVRVQPARSEPRSEAHCACVRRAEGAPGPE